MTKREHRARFIARLIISLAALGGLLVALVVPFVFETQTLWYKTGSDRIMLRAGQFAGMLTLFLLLFQIVLAVRPRLLTMLFGGPTLLRCHRLFGIMLGLAVCFHVSLVLLPEGLNNLPIGRKYWPEMVGGLVFSLLLLTIAITLLRNRLKLSYRTWRVLHVSIGYLVSLLAVIHVIYVSETFAQLLPRIVLLTLLAMLAVLVISIKAAGWRRIEKRRPSAD